MRLIFTLIILFISSIYSFGDTNISDDKDIKTSFNDAEWFFIEGDYSNARLIYSQLVEADNDNCNYNYKLALAILFDINHPNDSLAEKHLAIAVKNTTVDYKNNYKERLAPIDAFVYYGDELRYHYKFDKAIKAYQSYLDLSKNKKTEFYAYVSREIKNCETAKVFIKSNKVAKEVELGPKVISNTKQRTFPLISMDKSVTIYAYGTQNASFGSFDYECSINEYKTDDIYYSKKTEGIWSEPINITKDLNISSQAFPVSMTGDGETLYIVQDDNDNGNVYVSHFVDGKWTSIKKLNKNINSKAWETHACVTPNGETLYFSSDRRGGKGGFDLYFSKLNEKGEWGKAVNLGSKINTKYDEDLPFIAADNTQLYFCSQGHKNIGGFDIFKSKLVDGKFTDPKNIGYVLNSPRNDLFYIAEEGSEFTFSRLAKDKAVVIEEVTESELISINGTISVIGEDGTILDNFDIIANGYDINDLAKDKNTFKFSTKKENNKFKIVADGYIDKDVEIDFSNQTELSKEIFVKLERKSSDLVSENTDSDNTETENIVTENNDNTETVVDNTNYNNFILFDYNSFNLNSSSKENLKRLSANINKTGTIEISAFADTKGNSDYNLNLSKKRAETVKTYLINNGFSSNNIKINPKGETTRFGSDELNRRAEINIFNSELSNVNTENLVLFDFDKYNLTTKSKLNIDNIVQNISKTKNIVINAYTDSKGSVSYNLELSRKRANAVKSYLNTKGYSKIKIGAKGELNTNDQDYLKRKAEIIID